VGGDLRVPIFSMNQKPHSQNLRLHRLSDTPATFFITKSIHPKKPVLNKTAREIIVSALAFAVQEKRIHLRAFVIMPDHWHALLALREPWTLPKFMHRTMSFVGGKTSTALASCGTEWQDGYYDTRIRTVKQFAVVTYYIEQNPVVRGLIDQADRWDASSAKRTDLISDPWPWLFDEK
jgi:REP-associated tyrosine transposase